MNDLTVPIQQAPAPYVLLSGTFIAELEKLEALARDIKVSTPEQAQQAADFQAKLTTAGRELEKMRVELTAPFLKAQRQIAEVAKAPAGRIEVAKNALKAKLVAFDDAERARVAEQERLRQQELKRLEAQRLKEEQEQAKRLAEIAEKARQQSAATVEEFDDGEPIEVVTPKTEVEKRIEAFTSNTPPPIAFKVAGITMKSTLSIEGVDIRKLPDAFVERTANMAAIRSVYCTGWKEGDPLPVCAGVTFKINRTAVTTGR